MQEISVGPDTDLNTAVVKFVGSNARYYQERFRTIFTGNRSILRPNYSALLLGPFWAAARGMYGIFAIAGLIELALALVIVGASSGSLGQAETEQALQLEARSEARKVQALEAKTKGENYIELLNSATSFEKAAQQAREGALAQQRKASFFIVGSLILWLFFRSAYGLLADRFYAHKFERWRGNPSVPSGISASRGMLSLLLVVAVILLSTAKIAATALPLWLTSLTVRVDSVASAKDLTTSVSQALDSFFHLVTGFGGPIFDVITRIVTSVVNAVEFTLLLMPWPATFIIIVGLASLVAGQFVGIFTAAGLAYLVLFGFWEKSMETVALLGTATLLALCIGLPLGVICGKQPNAYRTVRPVLDLMQTMPAFVYLIPIIAFFGTGKTPGILATVVFGMPPVARLTALGLQQVPANVREASTAFGATPWQLLLKVEVPLAMPSIMAGVNQTILLCLSMVVIASLIGAGGLGEEVLQALQYASVGQGILAGVAILFCAIILDRIVQGRRSDF